MRVARVLHLVLALLLAACFAYRAGWGLYSGINLEMAKNEYSDGHFSESIPLAEASAIGGTRLEGLLLQARARVEVWEEQVNLGGHLAGDPDVLDQALSRYFEGLCACPGSRRVWQGIAETYELVEWVGRETRSLEPFTASSDPWSRVGRPGRVSLGTARLAVARAPNWYSAQDALARRLWDFGLRAEALEAVAQSARVLPIFHSHAFRSSREIPREIVDAFTDASWSALGQTPLLHTVDHLIDLGKLEIRRGNPDRAEEALTRALQGRGDSINRAESHFNLGLVMLSKKLPEKARSHFEAAVEHPVFRIASLSQLAGLAEAAGEHSVAMTYLRQLRRDDPKNLEYCLRFSAAAARMKAWPAALESLRWARVHHPNDPRLQRALGEAYLETGDTSLARQVLGELRQIPGAQAEYERLRQAIESAKTRR